MGEQVMVSVDVSIKNVATGEVFYSYAFATWDEALGHVDTLASRLDLFGAPGLYNITVTRQVRV